MKVVIACGGTGGHLFPGIAVAEELQRRGHEAVLIISEKKVDAEASAKYEHFRFELMPAVAKPKTLSLKILSFLLKLRKSISESKELLQKEKADLVLGMGGFTSFAPCFSGQKLGLRTYVHDSNAHPGKTNIMISKYCTKVLLGFDAAASFFPKAKTEVVGTPVRSEMKKLPTREAAAEKWGLQADRPTLLVFGGSQGAQGLNSIVLASAKKLSCQILHVTGQGDFERVSKEVEGVEGYHAIAFCDDMPAAYALADGVVCRSGASSMVELGYLGLPSLLVPYPYAADDHQTANAEQFSKIEAALMAQESELDEDSFVEKANQLLPGNPVREKMLTALKVFKGKDGVEGILEILEKV